MSIDELAAMPRQQRVLYVIKAFGPTQDVFATHIGLSREIVNKLANNARVVPAYAERIEKLTGYPAALFRSPRTASEAEQEAERTAFAQVQQLRGEVATLREQVETLARKVG